MRRPILALAAIAAAVAFSEPSAARAFNCPPTFPICGPATVIDTVVPRLLSTVAPGDATLVLRTTSVITAAWFDATAPYGDNTVGVHSSLGRLPGGDSERNVALMYASHEVLHSLYPQFAADWDAMLVSVGLDPSDDSTDLSTPTGIGNVAGAAVAAAREQDGMNQLGDADGSLYHRRPYEDYTGYAPVNQAEQLVDARRWQPDTLKAGGGIFVSQQAVTPQFAMTEPFSYEAPSLMAPEPSKSYAVTPSGKARPPYRAQANEVLAVQAALTDEQKLLAEFYDNKIISLGFSTLAATVAHQLSLEQFIQLDFLVNVAAFDTGITIWQNKFHYDAVRPFSAIEHIYGDSPVTAWGGPGRGVVNDMPASDWRPYLQSANHPEYPSASASFCKAHTVAMKLFLQNDAGLSAAAANDLSWWVPGFFTAAGLPPQFEVLGKAPGSSLIEPGVTPAVQTDLGWSTWDEFSEDCGISRLWAGVHFYDSIPAGQSIGGAIGADAYTWLKAHVDGTLP